MRNTWLLILLIISLVFNGFFIGAYWHKSQQSTFIHKSHSERLEHIAQRLALSTKQKQTFIQLQQTSRQLTRNQHQQNRQLHQQLLAQLSEDPFMTNHIEPIMDEILSNQQQFRHKLTSQLALFLQTLNEKQRKQFMQLMKRKPFFGLLNAPNRKKHKR